MKAKEIYFASPGRVNRERPPAYSSLSRSATAGSARVVESPSSRFSERPGRWRWSTRTRGPCPCRNRTVFPSARPGVTRFVEKATTRSFDRHAGWSGGHDCLSIHATASVLGVRPPTPARAGKELPGDAGLSGRPGIYRSQVFTGNAVPKPGFPPATLRTAFYGGRRLLLLLPP